jgi:hypothetical protein
MLSDPNHAWPELQVTLDSSSGEQKKQLFPLEGALRSVQSSFANANLMNAMLILAWAVAVVIR